LESGWKFCRKQVKLSESKTSKGFAIGLAFIRKASLLFPNKRKQL